MRDVVIVSACRTPIGTFGGSLMPLRAPELAAVVMKEALKRANDLDPAVPEDVRFGNCMEDCDSINTARIAALLAGIPDTVPAVTINRVCASAMEACASGVNMIKAEFCDTILVGGVESMSNQPYILPAARWAHACKIAKW